MKYFLDTEFIERGRSFPIELISIGIVSEDERSYYAISSEFYAPHANEWVRDNVLLHLEPQSLVPRLYVSEIAAEVRTFTEGWGPPEFWGYYADYDWVVFCQIFGTMMDLPNGFPMYCRDIKQLCDELGNPTLPRQDTDEHNALNDARWNLKAWKHLRELERRAVAL